MTKPRMQRRGSVRRFSRRETLKGLSALAITAAACSSDAMSPPENGSPSSAGAGGSKPPAQNSATAGTSAAGSGGTSSAISNSAGGAGSAGSAGSAPTAGASGGGAAGMTAQAGGTAAGSGAGGATGAAGAAGAAAPNDLDTLQCIVTPAMTEGPFFKEEALNRSDLLMGETADAIVKAVPLHLVIGVFDVNGMTCAPVSGVQVDIWHADALGVYSDVAPGAVQSVDTRGKKFLRGYQMTDEQGMVAFDTIYPGWYMSRTIHIHFKLRMLGSGRTSEFISQMFFDEAVNSVVLAKAPYTTHAGTRSVLNDDDHIYNGTAVNGQKPPGGMQAPGKVIMPLLKPMGAGYTATLKIGLMG